MFRIPCHVNRLRLLVLFIWLLLANTWLFFHAGHDIKTPLISLGSTTLLVVAIRLIMRSIGSTSWETDLRTCVTRIVGFLTYKNSPPAPIVLIYFILSVPMAFFSSVWTTNEISIRPVSLGVDRSPRLVDGQARSVFLTTLLGRELEITANGMSQTRRLFPVLPLFDDSHTWTRHTTILLVSPTVVGDLGDGTYFVVYRSDKEIFRYRTKYDESTAITGSFIIGPSDADRSCMRATDNLPELIALAWNNPVTLDHGILYPLPTDEDDTFTFRIIVTRTSQPDAVAAEYADYVPQEPCTLLVLPRTVE